MINPRNLIDDLKIYLNETIKDGSFIKAVYLFGSCLLEEVKEESDIDLALLIDREIYKSDPLKAIRPAYSISTRLGMSLKKEADVTILNASSLEMAYEIITTGKCIFEFDLDLRLEYENTIKGMYFDFRPFLTELRSNCIASL